MKIYNLPLKAFVMWLIEKKAFSFIRYGDGEWRSILGYTGKNTDSHPYTPELREGLTKSLRGQREIIYAMQRKAIRDMGPDIRKWLDGQNIDLEWVDADILHKANLRGQLFPFISALSERRVGIVGPEYLKNCGLRHDAFVDIPRVNCFKKAMGIEKRIIDAIREVDVLLFSASMATNVIVARLFPKIGDRITMIDCGSMWDVYAGIKSRGVYRDPNTDWEKLQRINFEGA